VKTGSPRRYGMSFLAIPVESRNPWTLNSDALAVLAFAFAFTVLGTAPERVLRSIPQV
jgi:hypothetical protein